MCVNLVRHYGTNTLECLCKFVCDNFCQVQASFLLAQMCKLSEMVTGIILLQGIIRSSYCTVYINCTVFAISAVQVIDSFLGSALISIRYLKDAIFSNICLIFVYRGIHYPPMHVA